MKAELEKIIEADERASRLAEVARLDARRIRDSGERESIEFLLQKKQETEAAVLAEAERIMAEARAKARLIKEDTDRYLERLWIRRREHYEEHIKDLLKKVIEF
jgi:hypothetical protein